MQQREITVLSDPEELSRAAARKFVEKFGSHRLTLTPPVINRAANIIFQAAGKEKATVLREVLEGDGVPEKFPAKIVNRSSGNVFWFLDELAAQSLTINRKYENFTGYLRR